METWHVCVSLFQHNVDEFCFWSSISCTCTRHFLKSWTKRSSKEHLLLWSKADDSVAVFRLTSGPGGECKALLNLNETAALSQMSQRRGLQQRQFICTFLHSWQQCQSFEISPIWSEIKNHSTDLSYPLNDTKVVNWLIWSVEDSLFSMTFFSCLIAICS